MRRPKPQNLWKTTCETFTNWMKHDAFTQSAALAFYTLFSLAPVLLLVIAIAGAFFGEDAVRRQIIREFQQMMGPDSARAVAQVLQRSAARPDSGRIASLVGVGTLLFASTAVFVKLQESLNAVWEVAPKPGHYVRNLLKKRLLTFALILGIGFLLLVSLVLAAGLTAFSGYVEAHLDLPLEILEVGNFALSLVIVTLLFAMIYRILPDAEIAWRDVWVGAVATSLLFTVGKAVIAFYLGQTGPASTYGAAGSLVVLLLWVYYSSLILLLGAEFTRVHSRPYRAAVKPSPGAMKAPDPPPAGPGEPVRAGAKVKRV